MEKGTSRPIRRVETFILRLWQEPVDTENHILWRGMIRSLKSQETAEQVIVFQHLESLPDMLRSLLAGSANSPPVAPSAPHDEPYKSSHR